MVEHDDYEEDEEVSTYFHDYLVSIHLASVSMEGRNVHGVIRLSLTLDVSPVKDVSVHSPLLIPIHLEKIPIKKHCRPFYQSVLGRWYDFIE